ncbi:hypothetical protein DRE_00696 [Drechslerella stenobrocha 248]|uniref:Adhesin domain-containing protein n=1 Tax=Drechslerella stenobrocha 248 TaxID=1043628 RepID=W7HYN6_9PEZI|nr:hypothetical protein DRE_00696 [Drechslerella stenobrocha 248]
MERRDHPSMEEHPSTNPYIIDASATMTADFAVADGYFGDRQPRLPLNPYITSTTETTADMVVTDGYFNSRPHQQLPVVHLANEEPVKIAMPELRRHVQSDSVPDAENMPHRSGDDDSQEVYSRISFASERSTLPPSYSSRRHSYEDNIGGAQQVEASSLVAECLCGHPQCISCVVGGRVPRTAAVTRRARCSRGCRSGHKKAGKFKFCCSIAFVLIFTWVLFGGILWKRAANKFQESLAYYKGLGCSELLPGVYEEAFTVPLNSTLSSFSLSQLVVYDKQQSSANNPSGRINVDGYVKVEHATEADKVADDEVLIKVEYQVSDEKVFQDIDIRLVEGGILITTNRYSSNPEGKRDICIFFQVTVRFPRLASVKEISMFAITTEQLSVQLRPSLNLKVLDTALLRSVTGDIVSNGRQPAKIHDSGAKDANFGLQARHLLVDTITGDVRGVWGLADSAVLNTQSGNIDIGVMPITSLSDMGTATDFSISSISGDVAVHSVSNDGTLGPFRHDLVDYNTRITTISGDIIGQYLLGSHLSVQTISGAIEADILPISPLTAGRSADRPIRLETDSKSGKTKMSFLEATDAKVLTEPRALLRMRRLQTVISWLDESSRRLWQLIQKQCIDRHADAGNNAHTPDGDAESRRFGISDTSDEDVEPLFVDPADTGLASLAFFKASHTTVSGNIRVHYPAVFEGRVKSTSLTGDIQISGTDVQIIRSDKNGPVGRYVEAVHGKEESAMVKSNSVSGDTSICIGDY